MLGPAPGRNGACLPAVVVGLISLLLVVALAVTAFRPSAPTDVAAARTPARRRPAAPSTTVFDNPFLPDERNLSDCISAVPKPGCGSEARGGWRQTLVFGVMALGLLVIAWRIATGHAARGAAVMTPEEFRAAGHDLIDWLADHIDGIEAQRVTPTVGPGDVRAQLPASPPLAPEPWSAVRADLDEVIVPGLVHWQHPGFFAYFPANVTYPSILAELASAGLGVQGMNWATGPACTEVETLMLDWMRELLGLPERFASTSATGGGVIHGSASEATLVAILAARWRSTGGAGERRR